MYVSRCDEVIGIVIINGVRENTLGKQDIGMT